eukprot:TRINITY_DN11044_c0_g1_i1.p1 TRINITY_DN11044_c0_g1~~TRINITY_DN11044_c0_g1_i1.p1  ORF type:complete len:340 (-),score=67.04 TRINITY_DN11044_c0_g1_i1:125-1087(-)
MEASLGTRVARWWSDFPLACRVIFGTAALVFALEVLHVVDTAGACFSAQLIVERLQVYRMFTAAYLHAGLLHIVLNLLAMVSLGPFLERHYGTAAFVLLVFLLQTISSGILILGGQNMRSVPLLPPFVQHLFPWAGCAVGMSVLLFAWITMHCRMADAAAPRSLFGIVAVPSWAYPWVLLVVIYFLFPGSSLGGHLSGILAAYTVPFYDSWLQTLPLDDYLPGLLKRLPAYRGSSRPVLSGVLHNPNASPGVASWLSRLWPSRPRQTFTGQGRTLGTSAASPAPPAPSPAPSAPSGHPSTTGPADLKSAGRFPGAGHTLV